MAMMGRFGHRGASVLGAGGRIRRARAGKGERGQATVELAAVIPVMIVVAVVMVNALTFFGTCASFDRVARQAVCLYGASPSSGEGPADAVAHIEEAIDQAVGAENISVAVSVESTLLGLERYTAQMEFKPTLFSLGLRDEVFGVRLPPLRHDVSLVVERYRPGVFF